MSNVSLENVVKMLNDGDWVFSGGHEVGSLSSLTRLTRAVVDGDKIQFHSGSMVLTKEINRLEPRVIGWNGEPREIQITGPAMVRQQRKKADGGGHHDVEQIMLLFKFVNRDVDGRQSASRMRQRDADRRARAEEERRREEEETRAEEKSELQERTVDLLTKEGQHVKCFVLNCDWKEHHNAQDINDAMKLVFNGKDLPSLRDVPDTNGDEYGLVISATPISAKQAQEVWKLYLQNLY